MPGTVAYSTPRQAKRITMDATIGDLVAVTVSGRFRRLEIRYTTSAGVAGSGKFSFDATKSDSAAIGDDVMVVAAGEVYELEVSRTQGGPTADWRLNLAADTASGYCYIVAYEY